MPSTLLKTQRQNNTGANKKQILIKGSLNGPHPANPSRCKSSSCQPASSSMPRRVPHRERVTQRVKSHYHAAAIGMAIDTVASADASQNEPICFQSANESPS